MQGEKKSLENHVCLSQQVECGLKRIVKFISSGKKKKRHKYLILEIKRHTVTDIIDTKVLIKYRQLLPINSEPLDKID